MRSKMRSQIVLLSWRGRKTQIELGATRIIWISAFPFGLLAGRYKCKGDRVVLLRIEEKLTTKRYGKLDLLY